MCVCVCVCVRGRDEPNTAVVYNSASVVVGQTHSITAITCRVALPSKVAWHPKEKVVVVGWANGEVLLWDVVANTTQELPGVHSMAVCTLTWSPGGSVLVSADRGGKVCTPSIHGCDMNEFIEAVGVFHISRGGWEESVRCAARIADMVC